MYYSVYEEVDSPDSVPTGLEDMDVHQAVVIATGLMLFRVKATYNTNARHCLIHSFPCCSYGVLYGEGQPLRKKNHFSTKCHSRLIY